MLNVRCAALLLAALAAAPALALPPETRKLLDSADSVELLSLDPKPFPPDAKNRGFHGYKELGRVKLAKKAGREAVLKALYRGIDDSKGLVAGCFNPRHGIRAVSGDKTVDLVICYECLSMQVFVNGKRAPAALTVRGPEVLFNKVLGDAKVPLPKKPD